MVSPKILATTALALLSSASALLPITIKGNRFLRPQVHSNASDVFFINGVDYQPGGSSDFKYNMTSDVLTNPEVCARDATLIQNLGVNTIRIYAIDPDLNHDECMSIFNDAGIYVILDVNSPLGGESLNRDDPESSYNAWYMSRVFRVIEGFRSYSNVIGFFIGNEVINDEKSADLDPPYLRAITRDVKAYLKNRYNEENESREIFVGYSAADVVSLRMPTFEYLTCEIADEDIDSSVDFFGLNSYEWCSGVNDWDSSGYKDIKTDFANSSVPVFFSEYGCNKKSPRTFEEVSGGIYDGLIDVLDGGLVYEYSEETSNYGLVDIEDDSSVTLLGDYFNFKSQLEKSNIPNISDSDVVDYKPKKCNATSIQQLDKSFSANFTLPKANKDTQYMIDHGVEVAHKGQFVNVDKYLNSYVSGASSSGNATTAEFVVSTGEETSTTSIYLTLNSDNLINGKAQKTTTSNSSSSSLSSTTVSSSTTTSSASSATVSSISTTHKNEGGRLGTSAIATFFGVLMALF